MYHFGFVMEQALGHVTHHQNLARWVTEDADICPLWMPVEQNKIDFWDKVPGVRGNWSLKASLRAREAMQAAFRKQKPDALFLHTQTTALFSGPFLKRVPGIISLDATPRNYDTVGAAYGHTPGDNGWLEQRKHHWSRSTFLAATALVTWCHWAKDSLVNDYQIPAEKISVIPPGVDMARWNFGAEKIAQPLKEEGPLRMLFVGADFERKGGPLLIEAYRKGLQNVGTLDIVTKAEGVEAMAAGLEGVRVHRGLTANSAPLRELYANADVFVFPTLADCLPIAVMEAMAAGLPVISTNVGALREEVEDGVNGLTVPPNDGDAVIEAVRSLAQNAPQRREMARAGREMAEARFDAQRNYNAILSLLKTISRY